jgi:hypothetical protein
MGWWLCFCSLGIGRSLCQSFSMETFRCFVKLVLLPSDRCIFIGRGSLRRIQPGHWMHVKASSLPRGAVQRCCNAVATVQKLKIWDTVATLLHFSMYSIE